MTKDKKQIKVSVVMPLYNSEKYVAQAIESVMEQTFKNWELIVVDDGSTDRSCEIVEKYVENDNRIKLLRNPSPNRMPSSPRNIGIQAAEGQYIAFLDSDDVWLKEKLSQQLCLFEDNRAAVVYSDYEKIDEHGNRSARIVKAPRYTDYQRLLYSNVIGNLTGMFDVSKVGKKYFLDIHHEDYAFWLSILKKGYIAKSTNTITALYREHSDSLSSNKFRNLSWQWHILRKVENINLIRSLGYFATYIIKGFMKSII